MVRYKKGHRNSKGEKAEWCIVSHKTGRVISSHKSKSAAEKHLGEIQMFKHMKNETMSLDEAKQILKNNGFLVEDTDDYSEYDFHEEVWNKINNIEWFTEDSNYYGGPIAEKKKADIDAYIREYYASMPDVDDCILRIKNGIIDNEI